jgi:hypothetical protein
MSTDTYNLIPCYKNRLLDDPDFQERLIKFCQECTKETNNLANKNMWDENWENNPSTLLYHLYISKRFYSETGEMYVMIKNDKEIIGTSGVYVSNFDSNVAIGGVRAWMLKQYRGKILMNNNRGPYALPIHIDWTRERGLKTTIFTFNEYSLNLINYFKRIGFGFADRNSEFFNLNFNQIDFPVNIQNTKQWVIYHKIDESYEPNWDKIRWVERVDFKI